MSDFDDGMARGFRHAKATVRSMARLAAAERLTADSALQMLMDRFDELAREGGSNRLDRLPGGSIADSIVLDYRSGEITVDGEVLPWCVAQPVEVNPNDSTVSIRLLTRLVTVIPAEEQGGAFAVVMALGRGGSGG